MKQPRLCYQSRESYMVSYSFWFRTLSESLASLHNEALGQYDVGHAYNATVGLMPYVAPGLLSPAEPTRTATLSPLPLRQAVTRHSWDMRLIRYMKPPKNLKPFSRGYVLFD